MRNAKRRLLPRGLLAVVAATSIALLAGCNTEGFSNNLPPCPTAAEAAEGASFANCTNTVFGNPVGPSTLTATPQRFPVVALSDNRDAIIVANGREGDDRSNPVHKLSRSYRLEGGVFGAAADLAGTTANTFVASANPDQSGGGRDSLVADATGQALAVWTAGNAGVLEMYANYYLAGFSARELIARPAASVLEHRLAMDGTGNLVVVWRSADGLLRVRDRLGNAALGPEVALSTGAQSSLGDVAFTGFQANVVWGGTNLEVFATRGIGSTWESPARIGTGLDGVPARLASHPNAPGFAVVAVWQDADAIVVNTRTTASWQSNTGSRIPGSEGGKDPQVTMSAGAETMVVWASDAGIFASRRGAGAFSAAEQIGSGSSPRVASDAAGNAIAVWVSGKTIRANRYAVGTGWLGQQDIGSDRVGESRANVAMDQSGRAVVVWEREVTATPDPLDTEIAAYAFFHPVARFTVTPSPAPIGATVTFDASTSSANGAAIVTYEWDFENDGTFDATGAIVTKSFTTAGARAVRLRVTDAGGLRGQTTQTLNVDSATRSLNLQVVGAGGRVTGPGLDCRTGGVGTCQQSFVVGTNVMLQALPDAGWMFTGWTGDCAGTTAMITVALDINRVCTATFSLAATPTLTVSIIGSGTVASNPAGIACAPDCTESYSLNTVVTLAATPAAGFNFSVWSGDCSGSATTVTVTLSANRGCTATFTTAPPPPLGAATRMSANNGSSYAATPGGVPYSWGSDATGTLGNGGAATNVNVATPMGTLTNVRAMGSGLTYGVAARTDGTVWAWGYAGSIICVSGGVTNTVPVQIAGATNAVAVSGGGSHTVILRSDGTVQAFGCNNVGQLGRSGTTPSASAVVVAGLTDIVAVGAGDTYSLALKSDGTVWAWGMGPLGDGATGPTTRFTPMAIPGLNNVIAIAAGGQHALALKSDGSVWAWGSNSNGKLGDGTEVSRWAPVATLLTSQITAISAGAEHSLALRSDGVVLSWGINETGQLGSGSSSPGYRPQPQPVVSLSGVVAIVAGGYGLGHSLVLRSDGSLWSWGYNASGQLGNGTTVASSNVPVQVVGLSLN